MNFQSFHFLVYFIALLLLVRTLLRRYPDTTKTVLLIASYYFYMCWDWRFAGLILAITIINFYTGPRIHRARNALEARRWLAASIIPSLGILAYFKYANFFIESLNQALGAIGIAADLPLLNVLLPVGISFYTFQSISYTLDIHRKKVEPVSSFRDFALFVVFFPQLVAGPIVRASHFLPQLTGHHEEPPRPVESGIALMVRGTIKKVAFADILGTHLVDPAFSNPDQYAPLFLLIAIYAYSFQVYMDFSGYTDLARGAARALGYELPINFNRPYKATSISNFWQRWHISMSSFFRDYLFFSMGGSKQGSVYFNLVVTFVAIGVWHGAGWNFVAYGICHAGFVCYERWRRNRRTRLGLPEPEYVGLNWAARVFWILTLVSFTRLLFRGGTIDQAINYAHAMLQFSNTQVPIDPLGYGVLLLCVALHYTPDHWSYGWKTFFTRLPAVVQASLITATMLMVLTISSGEAPFIYFQF
jgi:D-alanyl-lipoteichoic acid acyltransferase DltB (MBOAT superfamily)